MDVGDTGMFSTAWIAIYNQKTKELSYTNAGHWPALLKKKDGKIVELNTQGMALGVQEFSAIDIQKTRLEEGDFLLLYSDGVPEMSNKDGALYGKERLIAFLEKSSGRSSEIIEQLLKEITDFSGNTPQDDDISLLVFKM